MEQSDNRQSVLCFVLSPQELWTVVGTGENSVTMQYTSADGDDGYPGNVTATVSVCTRPSCAAIVIVMHARE